MARLTDWRSAPTPGPAGLPIPLPPQPFAPPDPPASQTKD